MAALREPTVARLPGDDDIMRLLAEKRPREALQAVRAVLAGRPGDPALRRLLVIARAAAGEAGAAFRDLEALARAHPPAGKLARSVLSALDLAGYGGEALDLIMPMFSRPAAIGPALEFAKAIGRPRQHPRRVARILGLLARHAPAELHKQVLEFALDWAPPEAALAMARQLRRRPEPICRIMAVRIPEHLGEIGEARAALQALKPAAAAEPGSLIGRRFPTLSRRLAAAEPLERWRGSGDVLVRRRPAATSTVFVFSGLHGRMSTPIEALNFWFQRPDINVVYIYDPAGLIFMAGVHGLGESFDAAAEALAELHRELGAGRLLFLGYSGGGYAALRYALVLRPERVLILSGLTFLTEEAEDGDEARLPLLVRFKRFAPGQMVDLRPMLQAQDPPLRIAAYYGALHARDVEHARNIADLPGVTAVAVPEEERHVLIWWFHQNDRLRHLIDELVEGAFTHQSLARVVTDG